MKKSLTVLLLSLLLVGCGSDVQKTLEEKTAAQKANTEANHTRNESNKSAADRETTVAQGDQPAETNDSAPNELSAALSGKRLHVKIGQESGWTEFHADGSCYHGRGDERQPVKGQWSASGNRLKVWARNDEDYLVFSDLTASPKSEVVFLMSADRAESEGTKGGIVRVEPIPSALDTLFPKSPTSTDLSPVTGTVTYDTKPLAEARIFLTTGPGARVYSAESTKDGSFNISSVEASGTRHGAPIGKYKVLISKYSRQTASDADGSFINSDGSQPAKSVIKEVFNKPSTTPLNLEVKEGKNSFRIDLKSNGTGTVKAL